MTAGSKPSRISIRIIPINTVILVVGSWKVSAAAYHACTFNLDYNHLTRAHTSLVSPNDRTHSSVFRNDAEFVPKFLVRREKSKAAAPLRAARAEAAVGTLPKNTNSTVTTTTTKTKTATASKPVPPVLSTLPGSFHKRYLMNFTVLSPEQQGAAQEADRIKRLKESEGMRGNGNNGWRGSRGSGSRGWNGGGGGAAAAAASHDHGKAALRELAQRGVLDREEVKAMLAPGPLQDFRGSVLQVILSFCFILERCWCGGVAAFTALRFSFGFVVSRRSCCMPHVTSILLHGQNLTQ